jgi:hypothetical protein
MIRTFRTLRASSTIFPNNWFNARRRRLLRQGASVSLFLLLAVELRRVLIFWRQSTMPTGRLVTAVTLLVCGTVLMMWAMWTKREL